MADKYNKKLTLTLAISLCLLPLASIPLTAAYYHLLFLLVILGIGEGFAHAIPIVLITSEKGIPKGISVGLTQMFGFFGKAVIPTLSGVISESVGPSWAFWLGVLISGPVFLAALLVSIRMEKILGLTPKGMYAGFYHRVRPEGCRSLKEESVALRLW